MILIDSVASNRLPLWEAEVQHGHHLHRQDQEEVRRVRPGRLGDDRLRGVLRDAQVRYYDIQSTQVGKATDPVFWVPLKHTVSWLFKSF